MTGCRLTSLMPSMMRSFSSCFDATRMWRRTERANLEKKPLDEVEPGAVLGCEGELEAARNLGGEPSSRFSRDVRGMIVEDQLDRGAGQLLPARQLCSLVLL